MSNAKILVIDNDIDINEFICLYLENENFQVVNTFNGTEALKLTVEENPDIILLEDILPDIRGSKLCTKLRSMTLSPIIFLSSKNEEIDIIEALEVGADDYITKPFKPRELVARIKSHIRRQTYTKLNSTTDNTNKKILKLPNLTIDYDNYTVIIENKIVKLSIKEFELFNFFVKNPNNIFSMEALYDNVWGSKSFGDTRTVMVHVSNLRKKIEKDPTSPKYIKNIRGVGYKFVLP